MYSFMALKVLQPVNGLAMLSNTAANGHMATEHLVTWLIHTGMCSSVKYMLYFKGLGLLLVVQWLNPPASVGVLSLTLVQEGPICHRATNPRATIREAIVVGSPSPARKAALGRGNWRKPTHQERPSKGKNK